MYSFAERVDMYACQYVYHYMFYFTITQFINFQALVFPILVQCVLTFCGDHDLSPTNLMALMKNRSHSHPHPISEALHSKQINANQPEDENDEQLDALLALFSQNALNGLFKCLSIHIYQGLKSIAGQLHGHLDIMFADVEVID